MIEEVFESQHFEPETIRAVQVYFGEVCKPLLESTEPLFEEAAEPLDVQSESIDIVLRGADGSTVAIAVCDETHAADGHVEDGYHSEQLKGILAATEARFGVLVTEENSEPDNWGFYELVDNTVLEPRTRSEFEQAVVTQLEESGGPLAEGQMLTQGEWEQIIQTYPDLQA